MDVQDRPTQHTQQGLVIRVSAGSGEGATPLAAFDAALRDAGVGNYNLIRLSSVIPPGSTVRTCCGADQLRGGFGDALYCVYAVSWVSEPDTEAWAGIGWARRDDGSGAGLFVEHAGGSEEEVRHRVHATLDDMAAGRADTFVYESDVLSRARCTGKPACAVVVASYKTTAWEV